MMKISLFGKKDKEKGKLFFEISDTDASYANTLRRFFMSEVPVMAIEDIEFRKNDSGLYDEIVAHRLGLVPLKTDLKSYNLLSECKCKGKGCARCQLILTLKAKGPGTVYSGDMKSKDPKVKPVYPKMPIVTLLEGQEIEFEATAMLGVGKEHAKWSPCLAFYKEVVDIHIDKQPDNKEEIVEQCPKNIFQVKNDKLELIKDKVNDCILCDACVDCSSKKIRVEPQKSFLMTVESWGQLEPKEIVAKAIDVYNSQLDEFTDLLAKVK
ncbi:MAG: DNA-directed RNA polymerase subunit D [Nanoarchaeota archaeon]|nr:DNA-directed RNA polymerase subunit D [Nanoarchaeota archaeon]MBU1321957.1 DNA-directed RNA polymerase subunit D [Nanoarchaeota archaeon]MBU1597953.1 DNA-directed RNA polymerase subunit D [Nanoarchaeota archaeon]MBU2441190.1 DNA-directed RNA polymerase subunit D [Nanoarchaeota archaeon]